MRWRSSLRSWATPGRRSSRARQQALRARRAADGAAATALNLLRTAWATWCDLDVVYEAARTRVLIALACRDLGDDETALMDLAPPARRSPSSAPNPTWLVSMRCSLIAWRGELAAHRPRGAGAAARRGRKTNRQIAEDLVISEKTVARHIANIFLKISVSSRSAAPGYAYQHGLT